MEPTIIYTTVRSSYNDESELTDGDFHLECRFSDGQKFGAVQVDREFPNLAHRISDLLNGFIDIKKEKPHSNNSSPYYLFVKDNYLPFVGFWDKEKEECRCDGEVCYPDKWFDLTLIGGRW